jgi:hypothetical protein
MEDKRLAAIGPNPSGLCMCGCGRKTKIVTKSDRRHGHVMGQPFRFIHGHSRPAAKGPNRFKLRRRAAVIFLERRDGTILECLVSRKDFHKVRRHHWYANKNGKRASYAVAWIDGGQVQMHKHLCLSLLRLAALRRPISFSRLMVERRASLADAQSNTTGLEANIKCCSSRYLMKSPIRSTR